MSLLEIRAAEASKQMNVEMQKLTEQGVNENKLMKRLTEKSTQDTKSMMIIALISAIFLPATFFAVSIIDYFLYSTAKLHHRHFLDLIFLFIRKMKIS
jgi:hypothetical protein